METALKSEADGDGVCLHNQLASGAITKFNSRYGTLRCRGRQASTAAYGATDHYVEKKDRVVITTGIPVGVPNQTNIIRVEEVP